MDPTSEIGPVVLARNVWEGYSGRWERAIGYLSSYETITSLQAQKADALDHIQAVRAALFGLGEHEKMSELDHFYDVLQRRLREAQVRIENLVEVVAFPEGDSPLGVIISDCKEYVQYLVYWRSQYATFSESQKGSLSRFTVSLQGAMEALGGLAGALGEMPDAVAQEYALVVRGVIDQLNTYHGEMTEYQTGLLSLTKREALELLHELQVNVLMVLESFVSVFLSIKEMGSAKISPSPDASAGISSASLVSVKTGLNVVSDKFVELLDDGLKLVLDIRDLQEDLSERYIVLGLAFDLRSYSETNFDELD